MVSALGERWRDALSGMKLRHLDRGCTARWSIDDGESPYLSLAVIGAVDTVTDLRMDSLAISSVQLTYFPGRRLAQAWLAAAWAGYMQHEALELVTLADGSRPLDPHGGDVTLDRGLRCGLPTRLTPTTLLDTFLVVMSPERAARLMGDLQE